MVVPAMAHRVSSRQKGTQQLSTHLAHESMPCEAGLKRGWGVALLAPASHTNSIP